MRTIVRIVGAIAAGIAITACSTADAETPEPPEPQGEADDDAEADTVTITGVDYGFEGFPSSLEVGTTLEFRNASDREFHEMVVMRLADDEDRGVEELLSLPDEEAMAAMTFVGVAVAGPGEDGTVVDGNFVLDEAGRYVATCFIPVGADPAVVAEAMSGAEGDGPPDLGDGAPHAMEGMIAEFTVG